MASPIIAAVRQRTDLKESLVHTAQEIAHLTSIYGVARVSYSYLAIKCHCCRQTVINHIKKLVAMKILRKTVLWVRGNFCETNQYTFTLPWQRPHKVSSQNSVPNLPHTKTVQNTGRGDEEKAGSLRDKIATLEKSLRNYCTPGSIAYESTQERIAALRALLARGGDVDASGDTV